jgi:hypothetical protein
MAALKVRTMLALAARVEPVVGEAVIVGPPAALAVATACFTSGSIPALHELRTRAVAAARTALNRIFFGLVFMTSLRFY